MFEIIKVSGYYEIRALARNAKILVYKASTLKKAKEKVGEFEWLGTWDHLFI